MLRCAYCGYIGDSDREMSYHANAYQIHMASQLDS